MCVCVCVYACVRDLSASKDLDEGAAELDVEGGVDHGVQGAVDVAEPCEGAVELRGYAARPAVGVQDVSHKEGQPADEEDPCDTNTHTDAHTRTGE